MADMKLLGAVLAGAGWVLALIWHVTALRGAPMFGNSGGLVFLGMFVVWLPAVIELFPLRNVMRGFSGWRWALYGAPIWMQALAGLSFVYGMVNFLLATGHPTGSVTDADPSFAQVGSGHAMVFYSVAAVILYAGYERAQGGVEWRCSAGHRQDEPVLTCPRCGADVAPARPTVVPGA
jgi:hypothetical protein